MEEYLKEKSKDEIVVINNHLDNGPQNAHSPKGNESHCIASYPRLSLGILVFIHLQYSAYCIQ